MLGCKYIYDYFKDRERERKKTRTSQLCKEERDGNKDGTIKWITRDRRREKKRKPEKVITDGVLATDVYTLT